MADPRRIRRQDAPDWSTARWIRWRYAWWLPTKSELHVAWLDVRAWWKGYCNDCPARPDPGQGGGYSFWRCALKRGHDGLHRARNYVWTDDGGCEYMPVPIDAWMPRQDRERGAGSTWLFRLGRMRWDRAQYEARRARSARGGTS